MKLSRVLSALILGGVCTFTATSVLAQDIKQRIVRFGYGLNEQSNQGRAVKVFADEVAKLSGGRMQVRGIGAAALGAASLDWWRSGNDGRLDRNAGRYRERNGFVGHPLPVF
jgi:TRAP-type C4-dicarboxylate transport system substrate-binding protein